MNTHKPIALGAFAAGIFSLAPVQAATVVNNGDSWVRESAPNNVFNGDLMSVWSSSSSDGARRYGVISFDLSTLTDPITDVSLSLWSQANGFSDDATPLVQTMVAIDPTGISGDSATWNQVTGAAQLHTFGGLGSYSLPAVDVTPAIDGVYLQSIGTAADAAFVESVRTGSGTLMLVMQADEGGPDYRKSWGDGEFNGQDAILATNADVPEPASLALMGLSGLLLLRRRR